MLFSVPRRAGLPIVERIQRATSTLCALLILGAYSPVATAKPPTTPKSAAAQNLLAAMRLWGDIKFFDPALVGDRIDWDAAFLRAEPVIAAATDKAQYAAAITMMLEPLQDLATHVVSGPDLSSGGERITAKALAGSTLITVPHGLASNEIMNTSDASSAVAIAAHTRIVAIDLRGLSQGSTSDVAILQALFSNTSPLLDLVNGTFALPRERTRAYFGYPDQSEGGYTSYFVRDSVSDPETFTGRSKVKHGFIFLVDGKTSLPPMVIGLVSAGQGAIYSTEGSPSSLAPSTREMSLPYGLLAEFRTTDLVDVPRPLVFAQVNNAAEAITKFDGAPQASVKAPLEVTSAYSLKDNPYAADDFPDQAMRMLAIARMYNVIRYFSPYLNLTHDDWDTAAIRAILDEATATNTRSYLLGLLRFYSHLHDSHGYVRGDVIGSEFGAGVPFQARYLHGKVVVTSVQNGILSAARLHVGDIIDSVNGVPIRRSMDEAEAYISASTPQAADATALRSSYQYSVFTGKAGTPVAIVLHGVDGHRRTLTVTRDFYGTALARTGAKYFVLPGNIGYVDFDRLDPSETRTMFEALKSTRAIIFDNRGYPKGAAWSVAPRLTAFSSVRAALLDVPYVARPLDVASNDIQPLPMYAPFYQLVPDSTDWKYLKPTVMLIDERTISQAEHSALFFRQAAGTRFVGTPTDGADGDITSMVVPGGVYLSFSGQGVRWPNGDQLQRVGIQPDVRVEPDAADIAARNDVVLQKGLDVALRLAGASRTARYSAIKRETARERSALEEVPSAQPLNAIGSSAQPLSLLWSTKSPGYRGWTTAASGYAKSPELSLESVGSTAAGTTPYGSYAAPLDMTAYRGKTVRIRGYLSAEAVSVGAGFWLRIDGPSRQMDNMQNRWLTGTTDWRPFAIVLHVPATATQAFAGLLLVGAGKANASALMIDIVPDTTEVTNP